MNEQEALYAQRLHAHMGQYQQLQNACNEQAAHLQQQAAMQNNRQQSLGQALGLAGGLVSVLYGYQALRPEMTYSISNSAPKDEPKKDTAERKTNLSWQWWLDQFKELEEWKREQT